MPPANTAGATDTSSASAMNQRRMGSSCAWNRAPSQRAGSYGTGTRVSLIRKSDGERIGGRRTGSRVHEGVGSEPKLESERSGTTAEPIACTHTECERGQAATGNQ